MNVLIKTICCLSILVFLFGCKKRTANENYDENLSACGIKDPIQNLPWLNTEFKSLTGGTNVNGIVLYQYNGKEVIEIQGSVFSSTNQHQYYCDGTKLNLDEPNEFSKYKSDRKKISILYGTEIW